MCTCGASPKHIEKHKIFQFLGGLNESYSTCKSNILMKSSLPSISKAYSMLQHDEKQKETPSPFPSFSNEVASFSVSSSPSNSNINRSVNHRVQFDSKRVPTSSLSCKYCKKPGHSIEKCYMLHGFHPEFKFIKNNRFVSCVQSEGYNADSLRFGGSVGSVSKSSDVPGHGFSKEQYQYLINLFQQAHISLPFQSEGSSGENAAFANFAGAFSCSVFSVDGYSVCAHSQSDKSPWILDSGATSHMTPHKHILHNLQPLTRPYLITLPNRYKVKVVSCDDPICYF